MQSLKLVHIVKVLVVAYFNAGWTYLIISVYGRIMIPRTAPTYSE